MYFVLFKNGGKHVHVGVSIHHVMSGHISKLSERFVLHCSLRYALFQQNKKMPFRTRPSFTKGDYHNGKAVFTCCCCSRCFFLIFSLLFHTDFIFKIIERIFFPENIEFSCIIGWLVTTIFMTASLGRAKEKLGKSRF